MFTLLARAAELRVGDFTGQDITNTAWVFATVGRPQIQLFTALAMAAQQRLGNFNAQ